MVSLGWHKIRRISLLWTRYYIKARGLCIFQSVQSCLLMDGRLFLCGKPAPVSWMCSCFAMHLHLYLVTVIKCWYFVLRGLLCLLCSWAHCVWGTRSGSSLQTGVRRVSPVPLPSSPETYVRFAYSWWEIRDALAQGAVILLQLDTLCITKLKIVWNQLGGEKKSMPGFSGWKGKIATQLSTGTHFPHSSCHVLLILCLGCSSEIIKLSPMGNNYLLKIFE